MPNIVKAPKEGQKVAAGKTLADLAREAGPDIEWKTIALLNWGTDRASEVVLALAETVGVNLKDLEDKAKCDAPETMPFKPHKNVEAKLRIPEVFKAVGLAAQRTHLVKLKRLIKPANAVSIERLDKWFIPETEECHMEYQLSGLKETADKLRVDVFASNYCECSDWNEGVGKYAKGELEKEPVYTKADLKADPNAREEIKWKGDCTTSKGMLGVKLKDSDKRHINVAFSPYTVQFTYHGAAMPETNCPQILLRPFWPTWKTKESKHETAGTDGTERWANSSDQDGGAIVIQDAAGVVVFRKSFSPTAEAKAKDGKPVTEITRPPELKKGLQSFAWDKKYRKGVLNGKLTDVMLDDSAWTEDMKRQYLYRSTPYKATVTTVKYELEPDSLKIKYKIINSGGKLKRGSYRIKDRTGRTVFYEPLSLDLMKDGEHELTWDGKYPEGVKNTLDGAEITHWDMPYRVEIQAHTNHGEAEGLALAVEHSEVRLYTHQESVALLDPRYDSDNHKPGLLLEAGPLLARAALEGDVDLKPFVPPKDKNSDAWFRYKLSEYGYYPGPLETSDDSYLKTSIAEFKRSVPKEGTAGSAGHFTRLDLTKPTERNEETKNALEQIRDPDRRRMFGDLSKIHSNENAPYFESDLSKPYYESEEEKKALRDPQNDVVIWADDRQYYTDPGTQPKNDQNKDYFAAAGGGDSAHRVNLGLNNYRGGMVNADGRVDRDDKDIPCPHIPFRATPTLMSREDELFTPHKTERVELKDDKLKQARAAIGPLRIDWSVEELPFDLSNIDPAKYPAANFKGTQAWDGKSETRTRRYVSWALWRLKGEYERKDSKRKAILTNCPDDMGGVRPMSDPQTYAKTVFGTGNLNLWPWKAEYDADTESVKTIAHDLIHKDQKTKDLDKPMVIDETGSACVWFRPSRIAGDGYRIGARVVLKKESAGDAFPNLETLEKRYPVAPMAHSAGMRVWRRSSFRGFTVWANVGGKFNATMINGFRDYYKVAHVYFVHQGRVKHDITAASIDAAKFKNLVHNNLAANGATGFFNNKANIQKDNQYPYPYCHHAHLGFDAVWKPIADYTYFGDTATSLWNIYNGALLYNLVEKAESDGYMRGHLIAEFVSSPEWKFHIFTCSGTPAHEYLTIRLKTEPTPAGVIGTNCPDCAGTFTGHRTSADTRFSFNGIGLPIGVTWCFFSDDANIAVHEVGHHRHFEHSANGPGFKPDLHDHAKNDVVNWITDAVARAIWWDDPSHRDNAHPDTPNDNAHKDHGKRWDRRCIMSYANDSSQYFCGKCVLRNRGWKVTDTAQLPEMDPKFRDPA
jgi:hypothetical protein